MDFLLGIAVGFILLKVAVKIEMYLLEKRIENRINTFFEELKKQIVPSRIEIVHGSLYMYHRETNEFLAQGKDFAELEKAAKLKYPNKLFNVPQDELNIILKDENEKNR